MQIGDRFIGSQPPSESPAWDTWRARSATQQAFIRALSSRLGLGRSIKLTRKSLARWFDAHSARPEIYLRSCRRKPPRVHGGWQLTHRSKLGRGWLQVLEQGVPPNLLANFDLTATAEPVRKYSRFKCAEHLFIVGLWCALAATRSARSGFRPEEEGMVQDGPGNCLSRGGRADRWPRWPRRGPAPLPPASAAGS